VSIEAIASALSDRSFKPCCSVTDGSFCFGGHILCNGDPVPVEIEISDVDFVVPPVIRVLKRPKVLAGFQPHFGANDELCYINSKLVYLDRYNPVGNVYECLDKASQVLSDLASKGYVDDTHEEFLVYWHGDSLKIDSPLEYDGVLSVAVISTSTGKKFILASTDVTKKASEFKGIGWDCDTVVTDGCQILSSKNMPAVSGDVWPLETLGHVLEWVKSYDEGLYKKIYRLLASNWILKHSTPLFILRTLGGDIGFRFKIDARHIDQLKRKPANLRKYIVGKGSSVRVDRYIGQRIDQDYVHSRNLLDKKNFKNKKILIVGCGTIGGYLASYLARLGAGLGSKGKLILCDNDIIVPANIGRHFVGMSSLLENKADAVSAEIKKEFPYLNIESRPVDVRYIKDLYDVDIVVDATGEEALSTTLNEMFIKRRVDGKSIPDVLYIWLREKGEYTQALLVDSKKFGCYSCLYIRQPNGEIHERFGHDGDISSKSGLESVGCEAYMPFPVTASVKAAAFGVDVLFDWLRGNVSPRLRTVANQYGMTSAFKDQDPSCLKSCPACQKK